MEDLSVTDTVSIEDVKVIEGEVTSRHNEISKKVFGYVEEKKSIQQAQQQQTPSPPPSSLSSLYSSCDIVKTRIGICVIAGLLFVLFFILSPVDGVLSSLGVNGNTLLLMKGILFCVCLYIVLYKLDICIT